MPLLSSSEKKRAATSEALKDFEKFADFPVEVKRKYLGRVPSEVYDLWDRHGLGAFAGGFLKVINPEKFLRITETFNPMPEPAVPLMVTGFGDILILEKDFNIYGIVTRKSAIRHIRAGFEGFLEELCLAGGEKLARSLDKPAYDEARPLHGPLAYDECYGYQPLLSLGGTEAVENLKVMKIGQYLSQIMESLKPR